MYRKVTIILVLAIALGAFLVLRPYIFGERERPAITDRLPDGDFIARVQLLNLAKELSGMLYYHKVQYRDFLSEEFILAQAKTYGLQVQQPSYFFANEDGSWGAIIEIMDSTKVGQGIMKLKHLFPCHDTLILQKRVLTFEDHDLYLHYDKDYLLFYTGKRPEVILHRAAYARINQISPSWRNFLNKKRYMDKPIVIFSNWKELQNATVAQAYAYPIIDSTTITLFTHFVSKDTIPFQLKKAGLNYVEGEFTHRLANIHVDPNRLKNNPQHPLYQYLVEQGRKVGFPSHDFIQAWSGDLSFRQGGYFTVKENYIESELDENFNVTEVIKSRNVRVVGFALSYSTDEQGGAFFQKLLQKGIITKQEESYYLLLSPPLHLKRTALRHTFYSSSYPPKLVEDSTSHINWTYNGTPYRLQVDSLKNFDFYGKLSFPMKKLLESNQLIQ